MRQGGPDALANAKLREALAAAKSAQVPTDIIDRNIKRASESKADYAEVTYEGKRVVRQQPCDVGAARLAAATA